MNQPKERFKLEEHEINSALWQKLKAHLEGELHKVRIQNDGDHDAIKTANLRGDIRRIKALLTLGKPAPTQVIDDGS